MDVRTSLAAQMTGLGYQVIEAEDGAGALAVLDDEKRIDLLFTDIMIPGGVSGLELARQLLLLRPELRVLYTTGYSEAVVAKAGQLEAGAPVLRKPYNTAKLAAAIAEILR
jgi:CheY-like chemotaxis protein